MALKEEDDIEYSDPTEVKIKYEGADETNNALRTFDKANNIFVYQTPDGEKIDQKLTPFKVIRDTEKTNWSDPTKVKVQLNILDFLAKHNPDKVNIKINKFH